MVVKSASLIVPVRTSSVTLVLSTPRYSDKVPGVVTSIVFESCAYEYVILRKTLSNVKRSLFFILLLLVYNKSVDFWIKTDTLLNMYLIDKNTLCNPVKIKNSPGSSC